MGKLTAIAIKSAKPKERGYKLSDGGSLYLLVTKAGQKYWRYDYSFNGKRNTLALGVYPEVSLLKAREAHLEAKQRLKSGEDPIHHRKVENLTKVAASKNTFTSISSEWFEHHMSDKSLDHAKRTQRLLDRDILPVIGPSKIDSINTIELLALLRTVETRSIDLAHRAKQTISQIFKYAILTGRAQLDPCSALSGVLKQAPVSHRAAITDPKRLGQLLHSIDHYWGSPSVQAALKLSPMLFQRPGEIREMEWAEINWQALRWEIPAFKMKLRHPHIVPLPAQAQKILKELNPITGNGRYVFPSARGRSRPLSENGVRTALRSMGFENHEVTPHGFRATARTLLDEVLRYRLDLIEAQLSHSVRDSNGRAYNRTSFIEERIEMMQAWADYLDKLKAEAKVVS
jgi:integrase